MAQKKSEELLRVWKPSVEELTPTRLKAGQLKLQKQSDMFGSHPFRTWWFVMICSHTSAGGEDDYILFYFTDERAERVRTVALDRRVKGRVQRKQVVHGVLDLAEGFPSQRRVD